MIQERTIRLMLSLPQDIAAALAAEAALAALKPSQVARALIAKALRERREAPGRQRPSPPHFLARP